MPDLLREIYWATSVFFLRLVVISTVFRHKSRWKERVQQIFFFSGLWSFRNSGIMYFSFFLVTIQQANKLHNLNVDKALTVRSSASCLPQGNKECFFRDKWSERKVCYTFTLSQLHVPISTLISTVHKKEILPIILIFYFLLLLEGMGILCRAHLKRVFAWTGKLHHGKPESNLFRIEELHPNPVHRLNGGLYQAISPQKQSNWRRGTEGLLGNWGQCLTTQNGLKNATAKQRTITIR